MIDSNNPNGHWRATSRSEFHHLIFEVVYNTIYLLNHRICKYLNFSTDFNCSNRPTSDDKSCLFDCFGLRYDFTKRTVSAARTDSVKYIPQVDDTLSRVHPLDEFRRPTKGVKVIGET